MWPFNRRTSLADSDVFQGFTDWHCHLLPGVDDGVKAMEETLRILALYEKLGIREVWLTPHVMEDMPNTTAKLKTVFAGLQSVYHGTVTLNLAAEYMIDHLFDDRLRNNDLLPLGKEGNHLLVETSCFNPPVGLKDMLSRIKGKGYIPVLAHPERYYYMDEKDYRELVGTGVRLQANIPSVVKAYGSVPYKKLEWLLRENMIDMWGTDTHHSDTFSKVIAEKTLKQSFVKKLKQD